MIHRAPTDPQRRYIRSLLEKCSMSSTDFGDGHVSLPHGDVLFVGRTVEFWLDELTVGAASEVIKFLIALEECG